MKAQEFLNHAINKKHVKQRAKNVILFLGDGMSLSTVAATRMYIGGEEKELSFEKFPFVGFSKVQGEIIQQIRLKLIAIFFLNKRLIALMLKWPILLVLPPLISVA